MVDYFGTVKTSLDPLSASLSVSAFAVVDRGYPSCQKSSRASLNGDHAPKSDAKLVNIQVGPTVEEILGHGDTLDWTGIDSLEIRDSCFNTTLELVYDGENIKNLPWCDDKGVLLQLQCRWPARSLQ